MPIWQYIQSPQLFQVSIPSSRSSPPFAIGVSADPLYPLRFEAVARTCQLMPFSCYQGDYAKKHSFGFT